MNESYFIKIFRNREGMSPAQYREQMYHHAP
jgi:YesN/AraC family two-component response regulator